MGGGRSRRRTEAGNYASGNDPNELPPRPADATPAAAHRLSAPSAAHTNGLGVQLRYWRRLRGLSQLQLSLETGVSSRHLSFLETGRSTASEETLERISDALRLSPADTTCLKRSRAGLGGRPPLPSPKVRDALRRAVDTHSPWPALIVDSIGTVHYANAGMVRMLDGVRGEHETSNLFEFYFAPWGFRSIVEDEPRVAPPLFARIRRDLLSLGDPEAMRVLDRLSRLAPDLARLEPRSIPDEPDPVLETAIRLDGVRLRLSSIEASPGSDEGGNRTDWRVETVFPLDDESRRWFTG